MFEIPVGKRRIRSSSVINTIAADNLAMLNQCISKYGYVLAIQDYSDFSIGRHYTDVTIGAMSSQITSLTIVYSIVYSGADHRKHQSSASLAFVRGIHRWPANSPQKWPVTRKLFPFDDVIGRVKGWKDGFYVLLRPWDEKCKQPWSPEWT